MATGVSVLNTETINQVYENATSGTFYNHINTLNRLIQTYHNSVQQLLTNGNLKEAQVQALRQQVSALLSRLEDLDALATEWEGKKAIVTTFNYVNNQPVFNGDYSELTNDDFSKGSVCFIETN